MIAPLGKTIEVPCGRAMAFDVFLEMGAWWPTERFATSVMRDQSVAELRVEPRAGGAIVEACSDGQEYRWGTIVTFEPPARLVMDFHVPHPSETDPGFTKVEVRFTALGDDRTRVEVTQDEWESLGDVADMAQGGYRHAWDVILARYGAACEGRADG